MKPIKFAIILFIFCTTSILSACSGDDTKTTATPTTPFQDKKNHSAALGEFASCFEALLEQTFPKQMALFFVRGKTNFAKNLRNKLDRFGFRAENLTMANYGGTYTFDLVANEWIHVSAPDTVVFKFPSDSDQTSNNVEIGVTSYSSTTAAIGDTSIELPTGLSMYVKFDDVELVTATLSNVVYEDTGVISFPSSLNFVATMAPYTAEVKVSKTSSTKFAVSYTGEGGNCSTSATANVLLGTSDYANIGSIEDVSMIDGDMKSNNYRIKYVVDIKELFDEDTDADYDVEAFYNNAKIGDLDFDGENAIEIVYKDGERANFLQDLGPRMDQIVADFVED